MSDAVVDLARRALAKSLRSRDYAAREAEQEVSRRDSSAGEVEYVSKCELTLAKALLAPLRQKRLERMGYAELEGEETRLRDALRDDITHYADQMALGKQVRARPMRRQDARDFLETPVAVRVR